MRYAVYADLSRQLTEQERAAVVEALDLHVPDGGCVGLQEGPNDEVFFGTEADSHDEGRVQAARYMQLALREAGLDVDYTLTLQTTDR